MPGQGSSRTKVFKHNQVHRTPVDPTKMHFLIQEGLDGAREPEISNKLAELLAQGLRVARASPIGLDIPGFKFQLHFFLAGEGWASHLTCVSFSFLILI